MELEDPVLDWPATVPAPPRYYHGEATFSDEQLIVIAPRFSLTSNSGGGSGSGGDGGRGSNNIRSFLSNQRLSSVSASSAASRDPDGVHSSQIFVGGDSKNNVIGQQHRGWEPSGGGGYDDSGAAGIADFPQGVVNHRQLLIKQRESKPPSLPGVRELPPSLMIVTAGHHRLLQLP